MAQRFDVHPNTITQWKVQLHERLPELFDRPARNAEPAIDIKVLHAKIGELTLESDFLEGALNKAGLLRPGIRISMDGKGSWRDNVFVERLWRTVKYQEVYLKAYETVCQARQSLGRYLSFYNSSRPHSGLDRRTPDQVHFQPLPTSRAA